MTFIEPSDQSVEISFEDRRFIFEQFEKCYPNDSHNKIYAVLGIKPHAGGVNPHSDPHFEWSFMDTHCFAFGISHGDDALLLLAGMIELGYFNTETSEVKLLVSN